MNHKHTLSYGSQPRASPFRRPSSPHSPSPLRQSTPNPSPTKTMPTTPSRLANSSTAESDSWTPRGLNQPRELPLSPGRTARELPASPTRGAKITLSPIGGLDGATSSRGSGFGDNNALSKLQAPQVRELREGFQILDRDSDGQVGREDVADMLNQLGLSASSSEISAFFPPGSAQTLPLPTFMNSIATLLAALSPSSELLSAFSAFDEDDSGQIDLAELRDALLHTAPEPGEKALTEREVDKVMNGFTGRRAFQKHGGGGMGKRGEVFKYQEFVAGIAGGASVDGKGDKENED